ncbi:AaceriAFL068Cp [[Ashbya] aceris (nom. inval.)]|nr:AaceriAFL068Cp [[Ashbya] aceris (nom. inval.)]
MGLWSTRSGISVNYSYSSSPTFAAEPWSVHTGRSRSSSSSSSRVSVFIFDKRKFENYLQKYGVIQSRSSSADRQLISDAYDIIRTQVNNLAKLKHPMLLGLVAPLEEHSKSFMFVTEYVSGCLSSIYQGSDSDQDLFNTESQDIIIQRGILQISHGLDFIHNTASSVHLDLNPRTVFVNEHSDWKIFGLGHLFKLAAGTNTAEYFMPQYDRVPPFMQLNLNYTAPEIVFENTVSPRSDYFSLGALVYFLYYGRNLFNCDNSTSNYRDEYSRFERKLSQMSWESIFSKLPDKVRATIPRLMSRDLYARYEDINEFIASEFFEDPLIKTLVFLDDLPTKSTEEKTVFLNGLADLLPKFPAQLLQRKFLTALLQLLDQSSSSNDINSECLSQNLHIIIQIGRSLSVYFQ